MKEFAMFTAKAIVVTVIASVAYLVSGENVQNASKSNQETIRSHG